MSIIVLITTKPIASLITIAVVVTGCSGVNMTHSVSPLDFFMPGLLQNCPPSPVGPMPTNTVALLAPANQFPL